MAKIQRKLSTGVIFFAFILSTLSVKDNSVQGWYPFEIQWDDTSTSVIDLRILNDKFAGVRGFLKVNESGHLSFEKTPKKKERFWGSQFLFASQVPSHERARSVARHFAKMGFNLWKTGGLEFTWNTPLRSKIKDKAERLDRFDYLFSEMKRNGVYCYLQLDEYGIARIDAEGKLPGSEYLHQVGEKQIRSYQYLLDPEIWKAERNYWRELLTHRNPHTGLKIKMIRLSSSWKYQMKIISSMIGSL